jgi:hypothetical protein
VIAKWGIWAALSVVVVVALLFGGVSNAVTVGPPTTTYTVFISEQGLPSGTSWSATFNAVTTTSTSSTIKFTGVTAGSYYYYPATIAGSPGKSQYVPSNNYYITVPNVSHLTVVYTTQYYATFAVSPSGAGTTNPGTNWYDAGSILSIAAAAYAGYSFSGWTATTGIAIATSTLESTDLTLNAAGTITADFTAGSYSETFYEIGLPASTHWTVTFDGVPKTVTTSSLTTNSLAAAGYGWSIAPVTSGSTTEYVASPSGGTIYMPSQLSQEIVFTEEFAVTFAVTGTGSVLPASGYYAEGSNLTLLATSSSHPFYDWKTTASKVYVGNTKNAGTNATVKASTTVTAVFKSSGSICSSKCSLTFNEVGLPTGSSWGVTFGGSSYPITGSSLALSGLSTSYYYWYAFTPVGLGQFHSGPRLATTTSGRRPRSRWSMRRSRT